jgi:TonB family protein
MTRGSFAALLAVLASMPAAAADKAAEPVTFARQFAVEVDATGQVTTVKPDPTLPAAVNEAVAAGIRKARFSAPMRDGRAVPGSTFLWTIACAVPESGAYRMAVKVGAAGPAMSRLVLPSYPRDAERAGATAEFDVDFVVQPDGVPVLGEIRRGSGGNTRRFGHSFEAVLRAWVKAMRFDPERLDGQPVATRMTMPVEFTLGSSPRGSSMGFDGKPTCDLAMQARERSEAESRPVALDTPFRQLHAN